MPLPEGYLPREGDVLTVHVEVKYDVDADDKNVHVFPVGARYRDFALPMDKIMGLEWRRWREDEGVISEDGINFGIVLTVSGDYVVVKLNEKSDAFKDDGGLAIFHCNDLLPWPGAKKDDDEIVEAPPPAPLTGSNDPTPSEDEEEIKF